MLLLLWVYVEITKLHAYRPKKYGHCPKVWVEDACKVLGRGFNLKRAIGATEGVTDNGVAA